MAYEISEIEFSETCVFCKEPMKGFIVFGKHTPRKTGGDVEFREFLFKKSTEGNTDILSLFVTGKCPSCKVNNLFKCNYNLEKGTYEVIEVNN